MGTATPEAELRSGTDSQSQISTALARHRRLLHFAVRKYVRARPDLKDDILAVGRAALAVALQSYRAEMGFAFSTYAYHQVQWRVSSFLGQFTRKDFDTSSLDDVLGEAEGEEFTLADVADRQAAAREQAAAIADENLLRRIHDLRFALTTCRTTRRERLVVHKFLDGENPEKIAADLDVTPQYVSQTMTSVTRKLRRHLDLSGLLSSRELAITI